MSIADSDPYTRVIGPDIEALIVGAVRDTGGSVTGPDRTGEYTATCPAHPDLVRSLRFRVSLDGRALLHCHAGCEHADVMRGLGLERWQTQPVRVEYDYFERGGTYAFTVVREYAADGRKSFWQGVRDSDGLITKGVGTRDTRMFYRADELTDLHTLWIAEGEKDANVLAAGLREDGDPGEAATTLPGGAARDGVLEVLAALVAETGASRVVVVCDRDKSGAGLRRGLSYQRALADTAPDLAVEVVMPKVGAGKDIGEVADRFGLTGWRDRLEPVEVDADTAAEVLGLGQTWAGGLVPIPIEGGRPVLALVRPDKDPVPILTGTAEPVQLRSDGSWTVRIEPSNPSIEGYETVASAVGDLTGQGFARWAAGCPGFGRMPSSGAGYGDCADALRLYLEHLTASRKLPVVVVPDAAGWVERDTGRNADEAADADDLVFVDCEGAIVAASVPDADRDAAGMAAPVGAGAEAGRFGREVSEVEAAWALWQSLTFADADVTAVVAGWAAATVLSPFLRAAGCAIRPGLAVIAAAESGKTNGAPSLIMRLFGSAGQSDSTSAAFRRKLQRGVGTIVWIDDSKLIADPDAIGSMRTSTARIRHELSNADAGHSTTVGGWLCATPAISAEGVAWLKEKAMTDRFIVVEPSNPRNRTSWWRGSEDALQWPDLVRVDRATGGGRKASGWVVSGLVNTARSLGAGDAFEGVRGAVDGATRVYGGTGRHARNISAVVAGLEVLLTWLNRVRERAGSDWPGEAAGEWATDDAWIRRGVWEWVSDNTDETEAVSCGLINDLVPTLLTEHRRMTTGTMSTELVATGIDASGPDVMGVSVKKSMAVVGGVQRGWPAMLLDTDGHLWVQLQLASAAYEAITARNRNGGRTETVSLSAITSHLKIEGVRDNPEWAVYRKGGGADKPGWRPSHRMEGTSRPVYNRLSEAATRRAMGLASE